MVTRRCTQRNFLLKPKPLTSQIFLYCIAVAALKTGVQIHAVCVMSNHWHCLLTDPDGRVAEFYAWVHKYVAKAVNASYGRWENLWSSEKTSVVRLQKRRDILSKADYILSNPVAAGLVAKGANWPGVWLYRHSHSRTVKRPAIFFRTDGNMPEEVRLNIVPPPQFEEAEADLFEQQVEFLLKRREAKIKAKMELAGRSFLGARGVVQQHHEAVPNSFESRRELNPRVAGKSKWHRIEAIQRQKEFLLAYREAYQRWKAGVREVLFPPGTYGLRVFAGVRCAPASG